MIITTEQKENALKEIIQNMIKDYVLNEANLKQIRQLLSWQRNAKFSPTKDGRGNRPSNGFYNHSQHVSDLKKSGIQPEYVGLKFQRLDPSMYNFGPIGVERPIGDYPVAVFKTKSFSRKAGDKKAKLESYIQHIVFGDWVKVARNPHLSLSQKVTELLKGEQSYHCQCMSDRVHYGYAKHQRDDDRFLNPADQQLIPAPIRNPHGKGGLCKHLDLIYDSTFAQNTWGPLFLKDMADFFSKKSKGKKKEPETKDMGPPITPPQDMGPPISKPPELQQKPLSTKDKPIPYTLAKPPTAKEKPLPKKQDQPIPFKLTNKAKRELGKQPTPLSQEWFQQQADNFDKFKK